MDSDIEGRNSSRASETTTFNKYEVARQLFEGRITAISEHIAEPLAYDVLLAKGIEGGLAKEYVYGDPATGESLKAAPVGMLNRNSFMYIVNNFVKDHGIDAVQFAMFDIGGVRQMDIQGAADYNLNRIALKIKEVCRRYKHLPLLESRYGGDEFAVAVLGKLTPEQQEEFDTFQLVLQHELATLFWNRRQDEDHTIVPDIITCTCEKSKTFSSPIGDTLYARYLQRGVILPKGEVNKMLREMFIKNLQHKISFEDQLKKIARKPHEYPEKEMTLDSKLEYHRQTHLEYQAAIDAAIKADADSGDTKQREFVLEFIEQVVYDQLLGENILTFADFMDHYDSESFVDVFAVEGKFLKEANKLNYLQGDNVKIGLWESIKKVVPHELLLHLTIANRAGSFLLGIRNGTPQEIVDQLSAGLTQLHEAQIVIRGNRIDVPLGIARESDQPEMHKLQAGEKIAKLREAADMNWYKELVNRINILQLTDNELHKILYSNQYAGVPDIGEETKEGMLTLFYKGEYTFNHLLHAFFNEPKRAAERRSDMKQIIDPAREKLFESPSVRKKLDHRVT